MFYCTLPLSLKSSMRIISSSRRGGVLFITLCTVLNNVDQASLWKQIITLLLGKWMGYFLLLHLKEKIEMSEIIMKKQKTCEHTVYIYKAHADW